MTIENLITHGSDRQMEFFGLGFITEREMRSYTLASVVIVAAGMALINFTAFVISIL